MSNEFRTNFERILNEFRTNFERISNEFRTNFKQISNKFRTNFKRLSNEFWMNFKRIPISENLISPYSWSQIEWISNQFSSNFLNIFCLSNQSNRTNFQFDSTANSIMSVFWLKIQFVKERFHWWSGTIPLSAWVSVKLFPSCAIAGISLRSLGTTFV